MSFVIRYGRPKTARRKITKGLREGVGTPLGFEGEGAESPWKEAKADGVSAVASAGGGRPVILAIRVRIQRRRVKIPRIEPRVLRRLENCSATETIAIRSMLVFSHSFIGILRVVKQGTRRAEEQ